MSERVKALQTVRAALPAFQEINDLYLAANSIYQRASLFDAKTDGKVKGAKGKALACAGVTWFVFDLGLPLFAKLPEWIIPVYVVACLVTCVVVYRKVIGSERKKAEQDTQAMIVQGEHDLEAISNEIYEVYQKNYDVIEPIPRDYRTYDAVSYFERLLENGHAESMKEALILYDEYVHREGMRLDNQRMIQQNLQQCRMMENIEQVANAAANNARTAAAFSVASFIAINNR